MINRCFDPMFISYFFKENSFEKLLLFVLCPKLYIPKNYKNLSIKINFPININPYISIEKVNTGLYQVNITKTFVLKISLTLKDILLIILPKNIFFIKKSTTFRLFFTMCTFYKECELIGCAFFFFITKITQLEKFALCTVVYILSTKCATRSYN